MIHEVYEKNKESLLLITEIVLCFRRQNFFRGSKKLKKLTNNLNQIVEFVLGKEEMGIDEQEVMLILDAIVQAQENRDYILLSDILEGDLLPLLQRIQMELFSSEQIEVPEYFEQNMRALQKSNEKLWKLLRGKLDEVAMSKYQFMSAISGEPVLKVIMPEREFFMHSTVNPTQEARILTEFMTRDGKEQYVVFGMGMGYHVKELLKQNVQNRVIVLENELSVLFYAMTYMDWSEELECGRFSILYEDNILLLLKELEKRKEQSVFFIHYPSLQAIENTAVKETLEDYFVTISSMEEQKELLDENFRRLQMMHLPECSTRQELFSGKTVVIVGAGPSVDDEIATMKKWKSQIVILVVGHIVRKLLENEIRPDAIILSDAQKHMYRQIEGLATYEIPLFLLSTASADVVSYYKGPTYLVYQEGYEPAEQIAEKQGYPLFQTGGSVSTLALDMGIRFGAERIILVGLDMAYTGSKSHAAGVGYEVKDVSGLRKVESTDGTEVYTSKNLDIYRKWIERRIASEKAIPIYNTARGARIAGTVEKELKEILEIPPSK